MERSCLTGYYNSQSYDADWLRALQRKPTFRFITEVEWIVLSLLVVRIKKEELYMTDISSFSNWANGDCMSGWRMQEISLNKGLF